MGKRINPAAIGGFIVGAVVLGIVAVLVFSRGQFLSERRTFVLYFEASVKGLNLGAPVDFKGVRVGSVTDIQVQYVTKEGEFRIPVFIEIEPERVSQVGVEMTRDERLKLYQRLVEQGLRAQLGTVRLVTGQLFVQLDFHPGTPIRLVGGTDPDITELPTIPTTLQQTSQAAQDLIERLGQLPLDQLFANIMGITQGSINWSTPPSSSRSFALWRAHQ